MDLQLKSIKVAREGENVRKRAMVAMFMIAGMLMG